ncbi:MAG: fibronectin type III domain-containing protein, partial [Acidimicrobiales bacterium]
MTTGDDGADAGTTDGRMKRSGLSRRDFMKAVSGAGFAAVVLRYGVSGGYAWAAGPGNVAGGTSTLGTAPSYTPEQIHLTWGADPSTQVTVSWASLSLQKSPAVTLDPPGGTQALTKLSYTDGLSGEVVYCYHVTVSGLTPNTAYSYTVSDPADTTATFTSSFTTANTGRFAFAFTSFGDLGTPGAGAAYQMADGSTIYSTAYSESQWNAYNAVGEVEA